MCDCIEQINARLEEAGTNTMLDIPIALSKGRLEIKGVVIATCKRDESDRKKPARLFASYCPFCGEPYKQ